MILQAYDFLELARRRDCILQLGGSDQYGNIVNGIDLARRVADKTCYGLTTPLITLASGAKMGKSAQGAVWLNPDLLSSYDYWQFWRNTEDADVGRFLRLFTEQPLGEIAKLEALQGQELNEAKKILATEATAMCHGRAAAEQAAETARATFEQGKVSADLPTIEVERGKLAAGMRILDLAVTAGVSASNGEARRLIRNRGLAVNDETVADETSLIGLDRLTAEGVIKLSAGKKRHVLIRPS
jgi:tyrosyl-tRNA synthetase